MSHTGRTSGPDPIGTALRRARRRQQLPPDAACVFCGWQTPDMLLRADTRLIEGDHVDGDANNPELVAPACPNCHAVRSEGQRRLGINLLHDDERNGLERMAAARRSRAVFFRQLAASEQKEAARLEALAARLDQECPDWREWPEATP
jgi:hypothetical protein